MNVPTVSVLLPGLKNRLAPEQTLINNWQRLHADLDALTMDQVLNVLETGPAELVEYLHFIMGGAL